MIKTFILNSDSHVEIDIKAGENGKTILTVKMDENPSSCSNSHSPLLSPSVIPFLEKTIDLKLMNPDYTWVKEVSLPEIAYWVKQCNMRVGYIIKWDDAESFWGVKYLRQKLSRSETEFGGIARKSYFDECFKM